MKALHAVQNIKDGERIYTIPQDLVLTLRSDEKAFNAELGEKPDDVDELATAMAVKLLRERAQLQQSRYYPYIQVRLLATARWSSHNGYMLGDHSSKPWHSTSNP